MLLKPVPSNNSKSKNGHFLTDFDKLAVKHEEEKKAQCV